MDSDLFPVTFLKWVADFQYWFVAGPFFALGILIGFRRLTGTTFTKHPSMYDFGEMLLGLSFGISIAMLPGWAPQLIVESREAPFSLGILPANRVRAIVGFCILRCRAVRARGGSI